MQHEESKSFQGVADCDLINARLRGAARRSRAVANRLRKLQSDDVVDLQDLQPDNLGSETELDAREVQGEGQDPGELEAGSIMVNDAAAAATSVAAAASSGAVAGPDNRDDAANFGTGDVVFLLLCVCVCVCQELGSSELQAKSSVSSKTRRVLLLVN